MKSSERNEGRPPKERISIIVPVYRVEKYLKRCVNSLLCQTYSNLEIILVDDGSPDQSGMLCDQYAALDSRVKVIHQENQGLSAARNAGLKCCAGEYITFVDSDDWLSEDILEKAIYMQADCVIWKREPVYDAKEMIIENSENDSGISSYATGIETLNGFYFCDGSEWMLAYATGKLFRRTVFEELMFCRDLFYEDIQIMPYWVMKCKKICKLDSVGYYYFQNPEGITHNTDLAHLARLYCDSFKIWRDHLNLYRTLNISNLENAVKQLMVDKVLAHAASHSIPAEYYAQSKELVKMYLSDVSSAQRSIKGKCRYFIVKVFGISGYALLARIKKLCHKVEQ